MKKSEVRNQKIVSLLSDLKAASGNTSQVTLNDNQKKILKDILLSFEDSMSIKALLSPDLKQQDINSLKP